MVIIERNYTSVFYLWSAEHHAKLAAEIERRHSGPTTGSVRHRTYVIVAVTDAVAFMESVINELLQDVADSFEIHIRALSDTTRERLVGYWVAGERSSIMDKYDHVLRLGNLAPMDRGAEPFQSAAVLVALRNYFVHYKPENISTSLDPPKLAEKLRGRFPDNALMAGAANPWFPAHAISAGCAKWAHQNARAFVDHWASLMGLTQLPYQDPGWDEAP
jgi:hypothetical protein